jgi:hypothetical protein
MHLTFNGGYIMSEDKKTRRQWLYDSEKNNMVTTETSFNLNDMTEEADLFLKLYGCKQYLADCIAAKGGSEFSDTERANAMTERFNNLCDDKFKLTHTESGFYFKDPDAVATKRGGIKQSALYDGLIEMGKTHEEAIEFINKIKA